MKPRILHQDKFTSETKMLAQFGGIEVVGWISFEIIDRPSKMFCGGSGFVVAYWRVKALKSKTGE